MSARYNAKVNHLQKRMKACLCVDFILVCLGTFENGFVMFVLRFVRFSYALLCFTLRKTNRHVRNGFVFSSNVAQARSIAVLLRFKNVLQTSLQYVTV